MQQDMPQSETSIPQIAGANMAPVIVPAEATVWQAWLAVARHPYRAVFVAWGAVTPRSWVYRSLMVVLMLGAINNTVIVMTKPMQSGIALTFLQHVVLPLVQVAADFFAIPYTVALFMPTSTGTLLERYWRVLRTWALAQVPSASVGFITSLFNVLLKALFPSSTSVTSCIYGLILLAEFVYIVMLIVNPLSASSGKGRWTVFGLWLLTALAVGALFVVPTGEWSALIASLRHIGTHATH